MKKTNFLKFALTLVLAFVMTGAFAQITLTIKNSDGTPSTSAVVYTITDGVASAAVATADAVTGIATWTPAAGSYNYVVRNSGSTQFNTYGVTYAGAPIATNISLSAAFATTIQDYVSGYAGDKITINKSMPFWVYPSPVHNPAWTAPAASYATEALISQPANLLSTFTWTVDGATVAAGTANDNYVELFWGATGVKTITAQEAAAAAYGACTGPLKTFYVNVINVPYIEFTNTADATPAYTVNTASANIILSECESVATAINPTISRVDNIDEEYPYYIKLKYRVFNATISAGNDITILPATEGTPANVVEGHVTAGTRVSPTNPLIIDGTVRTFNGSNEYPLLAAPAAFTTINNGITVYEFDLASAVAPTGGWNAGISRKSDYLAFRNDQPAAIATNWNDSHYSWITSNNTTNQLKAYIVILPAPATGPIYHIPNTWGL